MVRDPVTCMPTWIPSAFSGCLCQSAVGWLHKYINTFYVARVILPSCKYVHTSGEKLLWCVWPKSQEDLVRGGSNQITYHTHHLARMKKYLGRTWMVSSRKHICVLVRILRTFLLLHGQRSLDDELYFIKLWSILIAINFDFQFNLWGAENKTHKRKVPQLPPVAKEPEERLRRWCTAAVSWLVKIYCRRTGEEVTRTSPPLLFRKDEFGPGTFSPESVF